MIYKATALHTALLILASVRMAAGQQGCEPPRGNPAVRSDSAMLVTLAEGQVSTFPYRVSDTDMQYDYVDYLEPIQHHVIKATYWYGEGWSHFLIDHCTGARTILKEVPVISPRGTRLAMASVDLDAGYAPTLLQIWRRAENGFELEWAYHPLEELADGEQAWGPLDTEWIDTLTVRFRAINILGESVRGGVATYQQGEWQLIRDGGE